MATNYKKYYIISSVFIAIGIALLIFGFLLHGIIQSQATDQALMKEERSDLWAFIPGRGKVEIYRDHFFYNITNLEDVFFRNAKPIAEEKGPYRIQEISEFINRTYTSDNETVHFRWYKHFTTPNETDLKKQDDIITSFNLPSLGVWYQAKTADKAKVALTALYTVNKALTGDFYYSAIQTAIKSLPPVNSTAFLSQFTNLYFTESFKNDMTYNKEWGVYGDNNGLFIKAVLTHPSDESKLIMDYWGLQEVEMDYLRKVFTQTKNTAFKNNTMLSLGVKQWTDLTINQGGSVALLNVTSPGFVEYGAYLKYVLNKGRTSLSYEQAEKLFFRFNDVENSPANNFNNKVRIDDSASLINKVNLEVIFSLDRNMAIQFINNKLQIGNITESEYIYGYVNYAVDTLGLRLGVGGTSGIAAISTFVSQAMYQLFDGIGWDTYLGLLRVNIFTGFNVTENKNENRNKNENENENSLVNCVDILSKYDLPSVFNTTTICSNPQLQIDLFDNIPLWITGLLYDNNKRDGNNELLNKLNSTLSGVLTEIDYLSMLNSNLANSFGISANEILQKYNIKGNYKAMNLMPLAAVQFLSGNVTSQADIRYAVPSIKNWYNSHYNQPPEYNLFLEKFGMTSNISLDEMINVLNFDNLFSSKFIGDLFINYKVMPSGFSSKPFIMYLRYVFMYEVLGMFKPHSVKELLWGWEDDLLKLIRDQNYFMGGDPTVDTLFSLAKNQTELPGEENDWSMYTGVNNTKLTRTYKSSPGNDKSVIT